MLVAIDEAGSVADAAGLLGVLGNEKRFAIMCHLHEAELSVGAIAEKVSLSQSALSQHLAKLRAMDLVQTRRDRQTIYYSCDSSAVELLLDTMERIYGSAPKRRQNSELHDDRQAS